MAASGYDEPESSDDALLDTLFKELATIRKLAAAAEEAAEEARAEQARRQGCKIRSGRDRIIRIIRKSAIKKS